MESNDFDAIHSYIVDKIDNSKLNDLDPDILIKVFLTKLLKLKTLPQLFVDTVHRLGNWYIQSANFSEAKKLYEVLAPRTTFNQEIYGSLAVCYIENGDFENALKIYGQMETCAELNLPNALNKALCLEKLGDHEPAIEIYKFIEQEYPNDLTVLNRLALCYKKVHLDKDAQKVFKKVLKIDEKNIQALNNLGLSEMEYGYFDQARHFFERALEYEPLSISPLYNLSALLANDQQAHSLLQKVADLPLSYINKDENGYKVSFIKARCFEQLKDYKRAFDFFVSANTMKFSQFGYDINHDRRVLQKMAQFISSPSVKDADVQPLSSIPIFIVGLPRSGTTLLERLLSKHRDIQPLGELSWIADVIGSIGFPKKLTNDFLVSFRMQFKKVILNYNVGCSHYIDKMPLNFRFIPIIQKALPEAKIIILTRDRAPLVWSNYKQNFTSEGCLFTYDMKCLLNFHSLFGNFISLFDEDSQTLKLSYNQLIGEKDYVMEGLFEFLKLKQPQIDNGNLQRDNVPIRTASLVQVRSEIMTDRDDQWRSYKPYLEDYLKAL